MKKGVWQLTGAINDYESLLLSSGWSPELARLEHQALLRSTGGCEPVQERSLLCTSEGSEKVAARSLLLQESLHPAAAHEYDVSTNADVVSNWVAESLTSTEGSIVVRATKVGHRLEGWHSREIERDFGAILHGSGFEIDLHNPDRVFSIFSLADQDPRHVKKEATSPSLAWGIRRHDNSKWKDSTAPKRPFFKPVSLDPRLARAMANLACPNGGSFLDPFCGTGGIPIEAASIGLDSYGSDRDFEMVAGSERNSEWMLDDRGLEAEVTIRHCSATELKDDWGDLAPFDGFAFDPPYGRNSWKSDDGWNLFIDACAACTGVSHKDSRLVALMPWPPSCLGHKLMGEDRDDPEAVTFGMPWLQVLSHLRESGWQVDEFVTIPVHKSLARLLIVCSRA